MSPSEVRELVSDFLDDAPTVMPDGRMRNLHGPQWRPAGVHRRGTTAGNALAQWYETATEWFERSPHAA
jgi:hypothetical protein